MKIGELAKEARVNVETVRYYQRVGLLQEPEKPATGYRNYGSDSLEQLLFIRRAKQLGLTLKEIENVIKLGNKSDACSQVCNWMAEQRDNLRQEIKRLEHLERRLTNLLDECETKNTGHCSILRALGRPDGADEL